MTVVDDEDIREPRLTCDAKGCDEPQVPKATYWVRDFPWFHLCAKHWGMIETQRAELWRLLGIPPR